METKDDTPDGRRRYRRAADQFHGWRLGPGRTPVQILALGIGGCFIKPIPEDEVGRAWTLQIDLRDQGVVEVSATTLYHLGEGSAVTFFNLNQDAFTRIQRTVDSSPQAPPL